MTFVKIENNNVIFNEVTSVFFKNKYKLMFFLGFLNLCLKNIISIKIIQPLNKSYFILLLY